MFPVRKVDGSSPTRGVDWMLAHCSPNSDWILDGNNEVIKEVRKGIDHLNSNDNGSE